MRLFPKRKRPVKFRDRKIGIIESTKTDETGLCVVMRLDDGVTLVGRIPHEPYLSFGFIERLPDGSPDV